METSSEHWQKASKYCVIIHLEKIHDMTTAYVDLNDNFSLARGIYPAGTLGWLMVCLLLATLSRALCTTCFCLGNNMRTELKMVIGGGIERRNLVESGAATIMTTRTSIMGAARGVTMMTMRTTTMIVMVAMATETTTSVASSTPRTQCTTNVNDRQEGGTRETMAIMGSSVSMISSWVWAQRGRSTPILLS